MRAPTRLSAAIATGFAIAAIIAVPADAAPAAKTYPNCAAIHRDYSGGIAKQGVKYDVVHSHGTTTRHPIGADVKISTDLYSANRKSDRDGDGIACEVAPS